MIDNLIITFESNGIIVGLADPDGSSISLASKNSYQDNTFFDGTPFGIVEEE